MKMYSISIATDSNGPLDEAHAHNDDARFDTAKCGAAGKLALDLSDQLRGCRITCARAICLSSTNECMVSPPTIVGNKKPYMRIMKTLDTIRLNEVLLAISHWTS